MSYIEMTKFNLNTGQSKIKWTGMKIIGSKHEGTIDIVKGTVDVDGDKLTGGYFVIDMNSIRDSDLGDEEFRQKLEGHLKSDDFFAAEKFPTATFKIVGVSENQVTGELTIKGRTNSISFPAEIIYEGDVINARAAFHFDRTNWDIRFGSGKFFKGLGDNLIKDDIGIELDLVVNKT
jgi:polyisoprenoid-binding protein YceI